MEPIQSAHDQPLKILLTGADGLLGAHVCRQLSEQGYLVTAFVERNKPHHTIEGVQGLTILEGDILNPQEVDEAVKNADAVIHAAANTNIQPARSEIIRRVNIEGTQNVLNAAIAHQIKRLVFIGTANSFSPGSKKNPGNENGKYEGGKYKTDYMDSKYEAFVMVKKAAMEGKINAVTLHPTFMLGAYDSRPSSGAMILALYKGQVPGYSPGGRNYINVKDAAKGVVNALSKGESGSSYIIGNTNMSYREAFTKISQSIGVKAPFIYFPKPLVYAFGWFNHLKTKISGKESKVSLPMALISCDDHYYTAAKAVKELDLPQNPIEEGIHDCFGWFRENGYLK